MNSLNLLQAACGNWLSVPDQSALTMPETETLLSSVNAAVARIWRRLPAHYRRQTFSCGFEASVTGTVTATAGSRAATFSFTGTPQASEGREYCSLISGSDRNEYRSGALLHPWQGSTGTIAATLYHDATIKLGYLVERLLGPMMELRTRTSWTPVPAMESARLWSSTCRYYDFQRVSFLQSDGTRSARTLFRVARLDGSARLFESIVAVAPLPLTVVDAAVPTELLYDDEIADIIVCAAGIDLQTHSKFKGGKLDRAIGALERVSALPQRMDCEFHTFGTPPGH